MKQIQDYNNKNNTQNTNNIHLTTTNSHHHNASITTGDGKRSDSYYSAFKEQSNPLLEGTSEFNTNTYNDQVSTYSNLHDDYWKAIVKDAVYFEGVDPLFGTFLSIVYKNPETSKLSSINVSKAGESIIDSMSLERSSRYHPAIENLPAKDRKSNVRRALAVSALRYYSNISKSTLQLLQKTSKLSPRFDWDETRAGDLASKMQMITSRAPVELGNYLLSLGFTKEYKPSSSHVVDIVYNNSDNDEEMIEMNNEMAFLIGDQLENLFDPLTEYSPEPTEKAYKPPLTLNHLAGLQDDALVKSICNELITVQTNFTVSLVQFLQRFIIPLRIKVLEGQLPNYTAAKLNSIFPPTIDEVTRINCIFLDMLKSALPYGSFEVLKACGTTLPYFYKAYIRHEAATKSFAKKYESFAKDFSQSPLSNEFSGWDKRTIESRMYTSLNLPKIQLILDRLVSKQKWPSGLKHQVDEFHQSCIDTISSFGNETLKPYNHRVFTPTGKILTELASGWPSELQYGWLTRRVVALFDAENMLASGIMNQSVIIMFSDNILFLDIVDEQYYVDLNKRKNSPVSVHKPSIADVLMHSLVNEVPFAKLPKMKVTKWCKIRDVTSNHYNFNNESYVQFMTGDTLDIYKIDKYSGSFVNEVLSKSQILNKSQPFHLFKTVTSQENSIYYTAHDLKSYYGEQMLAPFVVLLNSRFKTSYLNSFNVFGVVTLNFADDGSDDIEVQAYSRCSTGKTIYNCKKYELASSLAETIETLMSRFFSLENSMMGDKLMKCRAKLVDTVASNLRVSDEELANELKHLKSRAEQLARESHVQDELRNAKRGSRANSLDLLDRPENVGIDGRISSTKITKSPVKPAAKKAKKKKSGFMKLFSKKSKDSEVVAAPVAVKPVEKKAAPVSIPAPAAKTKSTKTSEFNEEEKENIKPVKKRKSWFFGKDKDHKEKDKEHKSAKITEGDVPNGANAKLPNSTNKNLSSHESESKNVKDTVDVPKKTLAPPSTDLKNISKDVAGSPSGDRDLTDVIDEVKFQDIAPVAPEKNAAEDHKTKATTSTGSPAKTEASLASSIKPSVTSTELSAAVPVQSPKELKNPSPSRSNFETSTTTSTTIMHPINQSVKETISSFCFAFCPK
ncbi:unnamed protein product [Ambrosiozyma monospora]|uniref:Unnamed protein product n=1 Tax=Ambrosiozyma monospora TaxID=43982 RepID=A0ACB5SZC2_AMBMO|nr:unnamed protein product [Ambrosiozyma monospora]